MGFIRDDLSRSMGVSDWEGRLAVELLHAHQHYRSPLFDAKNRDLLEFLQGRGGSSCNGDMRQWLHLFIVSSHRRRLFNKKIFPSDAFGTLSTCLLALSYYLCIFLPQLELPSVLGNIPSFAM